MYRRRKLHLKRNHFPRADIANSRKELNDVKQLSDRATDVLRSRIENIFEEMSSTQLCNIFHLIPLPHDFLKHIEVNCARQAAVLSKWEIVHLVFVFSIVIISDK